MINGLIVCVLGITLLVSSLAVAAPSTPTEDFTDNGDGTVTHRTTGLTWMRCQLGMTWTGSTCTGTASAFSEAQASSATATFAGKSDWRLPNIAELNSIVERTAIGPALNTTVFPNPHAGYFWSGSPYLAKYFGHGFPLSYSSSPWYVAFSEGNSSYGLMTNLLDFQVSVRLVRGGAPFDPLALYTPSSDFVDNGDGTVNHLKTGLMWKRCAEGQTWNGSTCSGTTGSYDWNSAVALTSSSAGFSDWRLPTESELLTIVEFQAYTPAINTTIFPGTPGNSFFWSATPYALSEFAWSVAFGYGHANYSARTSAGSVRLVRRGQFFSPLGFSGQIGVTPGTAITSNTLKVLSNESVMPISIVGGSYSINAGAFSTAPGTVKANDSVTLRISASSSLATTTRATLSIGSISGDFGVTTAATADTETPTVPSHLIASVSGTDKVTLAWNAATDNVGVTAYQIYRNASLVATLGNVTSVVDAGLSPATLYTYRIAACDAANNCSIQSTSASATTRAAVSASPTTPITDFIDNGDGTVTHRITGLTWMRCARGMAWDGQTCTGSASTFTWDQATKLTATYAGNNDWRLPSIAEWNTIIETGDVYSRNNQTLFPNMPNLSFGATYWSNSSYVVDPFYPTLYLDTAWGANISYSGNMGEVSYAYFFQKTQKYFARLVRGGQLSNSTGSPAPNRDLVDNGDGTVTDLKSGLMWKRCDEGLTWDGSRCIQSGTGETYDWYKAVALTSSGLGYIDWRLPTVRELLTLVDYQANHPAINAALFPYTRYGSYWSSSPSVRSSLSAWTVDFMHGFVGETDEYGNSRDVSMLVHLVRHGQFFSALGFMPQVGVAPNSTITSSTLKVTRVGDATPISIVGGSYSINGATFTKIAGTVSPNDTVTVRLTSSPTLGATSRATLTIGAVSGDFIVTTVADNQPPGAPSNLRASAVGTGQISLTWDTATDGVGVTNYRIYRNGSLIKVLTSATSYSDVPLGGASRFSYIVTACDAASNCSAPSNAAVATLSSAAKLTPIIAGGGNHSASLTNDGKLSLWGFNDSSQLGDGTTRLHSNPLAVGAGYRAVALGGSHSVAIKTDGTLWTWGSNASGQLGDGKTITGNVPIQVGTGYVTVATGNSHTVGIKDDRSLWAWGNNGSGQLGDGTIFSRNAPTPIGTDYYAVAAGISHSAAIKTDGSLWTWGANTSGQLGDGMEFDRYSPTLIGSGYSAVSAGAYHTLAIKVDGSLWAWGRNDLGQLGDGTTLNRNTPTQVGTGFIAVAAGTSHTVAMRTDGSLWSWGSNANGQLGDGTTTNRNSPGKVSTLGDLVMIAAGGNHTLALKSDGSAWGWGANSAGAVGDGTTADAHLPVHVVNESSTGFLSLTGATLDNAVDPFKILQIVGKTSTDLNTKLTDLRASGFTGEIYFSALLPPSSPLVRLMKRGHKETSIGMVPMVFGRSGYKQTGPTIIAEANSTGSLTTGSQYTVYEKAAGDPLAASNAIICMGLTVSGLSAKGQVLMRPIATGDKLNGVTQCPTVQTDATTKTYVAQVSGPITARTIAATINPLAEDRGQVRNVYSWAVAPNGTQFMQTGPNSWALMAEPMLPAMTAVTVPASGAIILPVLSGFDLSSLVGTLVYVGMGANWEEVRSLNMAGHYYTIQ